MKQFPKVFILVFVLLVFGCGKRLPPPPDGMSQIVPCLVEVRFDGQTIEGVTVLFRPKDTDSRWSAGGTTDTEGKAVMRTAGYYDGVVPGEYTVSFRKVDHLLLSPCGMPIRSLSAIPVQYTAAHSQKMITVTENQSVYVFELDGVSDSKN
jgi:hypothetical protein